MSKFRNFAKTLGLVIANADVKAINPVIFRTKVPANSFGTVEVVDNVPMLLDVENNDAKELTADAVKDATITGLKAEKPSKFEISSISASENCGTIDGIVFTKDGGVSCPMSVVAFAKDNGMKISDVDVAVQNAVIFSTRGIPSLSNLTENDGKFYKIDLDKNEATIVDADALAKQAVSDMKALKNTEAVTFAEKFGLIKSLVMNKKSAKDADQPVD